ncbi:hypothetical protein PENSPDRAFT_553629, partial [Peniophora sp. CONT]
ELQKGHCIDILQLTSGNIDILGYVYLPIFKQAKSGVLLEFELEAYIVRNMGVPIRLGEDF